ncbi:MAG: tyrosine-protein phosphatase [Lentisphaerae bacterium]|nr:tyrosine-protein phosphatase [Lentisphaerota bacterium]
MNKRILGIIPQMLLVFTASAANWFFDPVAKTMNDGVWTFTNVTATATDLAVGACHANGYPSEFSTLDPLYFNCAVGSDRTGTIAFLLDGVIGREDRYFYDNYELPSFNVNLPRYRYCRKGSELFGYFAPKDGGTIRESVVQYLLGIGVTQAEIDSIRKIMVEK